MRKFIALGFVVLLAGCGSTVRMPDVDQAAIERETEKQVEAAVLMRRDLIDKLDRVWPKLLHASAPMCGDKVGYSVGFAYLNNVDESKPMGRAQRRVHGDGVVVISAPFPADDAGLRRGDVVSSANGLAVTPDRAGRSRLQGEIDRSWKDGTPLRLNVRRGNETRDIVIRPAKSCGFPIRMVDSIQINAFTDGTRIGITSGMVRFLETDDEMAFLLGHEMGHAIQNHVAKQQANRAAGAAIGLLITALTGTDATGIGAELGGLAVSKDLEHEADVVGLYLAARAGFDVSKVPDLWRRMSAVAPKAMHTHPLGTHPSNVSRAILVERVVAEIAAKKAAGQPLVPTLKDQTAAR